MVLGPELTKNDDTLGVALLSLWRHLAAALALGLPSNLGRCTVACTLHKEWEGGPEGPPLLPTAGRRLRATAAVDWQLSVPDGACGEVLPDSRLT